MFKKLFFTAAAAAAVSVPLAGAAWASPPDDPGSGNQGVPDKAKNFIESNFGPDATLDPVTGESLASGNSGVLAPGTAFSSGAKVSGVNAPEGYADALNTFYDQQIGANPGYVRVIPGQAAKLFTPGCGTGNQPQPANCVS